MENLLLNLRKKLDAEIKTKQNIINGQKEKVKNIKKFLDELENNFYDLMKQEKNLDDFLEFLYNTNEEYIHFDKIENLIKSIRKIDATKLSIDRFYENVSILANSINKIINDKIKDIKIKEEEIEKLTEIINNISNDGEFIRPMSEKMNIELIEFVKILKLKNFDLIREITLKNNSSYERMMAKQNAEKIRKLKTSNSKQVNIEIPKEPDLTEEQQKIVNKIEEIINKSTENIKTIDEEEEAYLDLLYIAKSKEEIVEVLQYMKSDNSSLALILFGISNLIKNIKENSELLSIYIELYNEYQEKIRINNESKEEYEKLIIEYEKIKESIEKDSNDIFNKLTTQQIIFFNSFEEIEVEYKNEINSMLEKYDINFNLLLFYKEYIKIKNKIDSFEKNKNFERYKESLEEIKEIILTFKEYEKLKQEYTDSKKTPKEEIKDELNTNDENYIIFLTNEEGIPYMQENIQNSQYEFGAPEFKAVKELLKQIKGYDANKIHEKSSPVKPDSDTYKRKRIDHKDIRIIILQISNKYENIKKPIYLIITGGVKFDSKQAEVYQHTNYLEDIAKAYKKKIESLTEKEMIELLKKQPQIEEELLKAVTPKKISRKR